MREEVFLLGRILLTLVFLGSGMGHLMQTEGSVQYATYKKVPSPKLAVQVSGVLMILGAVAVVLGIWMDLAALGLAILVVVMAFMMHRFWEETDPQAKQVEMSMFMKNLSIAGGGLILAAVARGSFAPYTITDGVF
jgi:uncharacterized membrane protein YphA (DoxX/SURF4 family)